MPVEFCRAVGLPDAPTGRRPGRMRPGARASEALRPIMNVYEDAANSSSI